MSRRPVDAAFRIERAPHIDRIDELSDVDFTGFGIHFHFAGSAGWKPVDCSELFDCQTRLPVQLSALRLQYPRPRMFPPSIPEETLNHLLDGDGPAGIGLREDLPFADIHIFAAASIMSEASSSI